MTKGVPEGWHSITPRLVVNEPGLLVDFLRRAFQGTGDFHVEAPAIIRIGDSLVMISGAGPRDAITSFLYLYVEDVDASYRLAMEAGASSLEEPREVPYGDRRAMIKDPCGNTWQIATRISG